MVIERLGFDARHSFPAIKATTISLDSQVRQFGEALSRSVRYEDICHQCVNGLLLNCSQKFGNVYLSGYSLYDERSDQLTMDELFIDGTDFWIQFGFESNGSFSMIHFSYKGDDRSLADFLTVMKLVAPMWFSDTDDQAQFVRGACQ